ncbi:MAG: 50S ribosomal protein L32 [Candidatus Blackburnbacteria bacterium]|nr:50S ribosomal protein L32 [Candidatus Blackburnbacteria bacterium]
MAPLPKRRHTKSRTGKRRANKKLLLPNLSACPSCKKLKRPHMICPHCGYYGKGNRQ